eukprot:2559230-Lingulodinium_polyedra.AAC.1
MQHAIRTLYVRAHATAHANRHADAHVHAHARTQSRTKPNARENRANTSVQRNATQCNTMQCSSAVQRNA